MAYENVPFYKNKFFWINLSIAGVIIIVISLLLTLLKDKRDYKDYTNYNITNEKVFNQNEEAYYVYFYKESCSACANIKPNIFDYLDSKKENKLPLYLFDITKNDMRDNFVETEEEVRMIDITNFTDLKLIGTPTLIEIKNKKTVFGSYNYNVIAEKLRT